MVLVHGEDSVSVWLRAVCASAVSPVRSAVRVASVLGVLVLASMAFVGCSSGSTGSSLVDGGNGKASLALPDAGDARSSADHDGDDGGDEGNDAAARKDSSSTATDASGNTSKCDELVDCCDWLGAGHKLYSICVAQADTGQRSVCAAELNSLRAAGYCAGSTACTNLASCCNDVPSSNTAYCQNFVADKSEIQCARAHTTFRTEGWCQ